MIEWLDLYIYISINTFNKAPIKTCLESVILLGLASSCITRIAKLSLHDQLRDPTTWEPTEVRVIF